MKTKKILIASLVINSLFLIFSAYVFRDKWIQKLISLRGDATVVMFGNSLTAQGKWAELLGRTDVLTSGFPGLCTYHFISLVQNHVIERHPKICFIEAGINDITVGVSQEKIQQHYHSILSQITDQNIIPVVILTLHEQNDPESKKEVDFLNRFLTDYCKKNNIGYLDLNPFLSDSSGLKAEFAVDKTHLNTKAYQIWAREVNKILQQRKI